MKETGISSLEFSLGRVRAKKAKLISPQKMTEIAQTDTVSEAIEMLKDTEYSENISKDEDYFDVDRELSNHLLEEENNIAKYSPEILKKVFREYMNRWDVQNLKVALRAIKEKDHEYREFLIKTDSELYKLIDDIAESENYKEAAEKLKDTEYEFLVPILQEIDEEHDGLIEPEVLLDLKLYENIMDKVTRSDTRVKKYFEKHNQNIEKYFGLLVDRVNVETVLRSIRDEMEPEEVEEFLINPYQIDMDTLLTMAEYDELGNAVLELKDTYFETLAELHDCDCPEVIEEASIKLDKLQKKTAMEIYRDEPLGPGVILGYLALKRIEIQNLRKIFTYKNAGIGYEDIKEVLVL
ncbi:Archaeal/vacuolar-type H+-ATPase subunit C [Methanonatronarchaeum thermophilum]|uniref:Archaeal/vacuolar-type H+-ATPase subunit C n=1 Tax=Methanonatronarchaeum thermophilum TaxID=1927129 RepID=A0A1Y3GD12_9EURY|nr:V-type ATPase subunit [Methanonatronarchaeum thermophilum]OUJ19127.1 Archaeal/vacuolar-type H+-ATPase subunit C [Methanonatronarchaeum thermophilum]